MFSSLFSKLNTWLKTRALNPGAKANAQIDSVIGAGGAEAVEGEAADLATGAVSTAVSAEVSKVKL